jgi:hypothetical protein
MFRAEISRISLNRFFHNDDNEHELSYKTIPQSEAQLNKDCLAYSLMRQALLLSKLRRVAHVY